MNKLLNTIVFLSVFMASGQSHPKFRFGIYGLGNALATNDYRFGAQLDLSYQMSPVLAFGAEVRGIDEHLIEKVESSDFNTSQETQFLNRQAMQIGGKATYYFRRHGKYRPNGSLCVGYQLPVNLQVGPLTDGNYAVASASMRNYFGDNSGFYTACQLGIDIKMNNRTSFCLGGRFTLAPHLRTISNLEFNLTTDDQGGVFQLNAYELRSYSPVSFYLGLNFKIF